MPFQLVPLELFSWFLMEIREPTKWSFQRQMGGVWESTLLTRSMNRLWNEWLMEIQVRVLFIYSFFGPEIPQVGLPTAFESRGNANGVST
jgi:hypothetical protein